MGTGILARQTSNSKTVETSSSDGTVDAPTSSVDGLTGLFRRQTEEELEEEEELELLAFLASQAGVPAKRQLNGLLGDKPATDDGDGDDTKQTLSSDDGTNGENSFDAQEDSAAKDAEVADADADAAAISAGFDGSSAAVFAVAHDDGELAFGARSHNGDVRSGGGSGGCVSEIRSAPAPPASAFVERVDVGFVFFLPLRPGCCHQNSLLWAAIILPSFNERIARRGVRLALLLANHSLESLQTAADLAETAAASFQTAAVPLLQRRRR